MKKLEKSVPVIRFKGFSEAWEQRKLGEDVNFLNGRAYSQKELLDKGKYKVLRVGNFNTNDRWYYSDLELEENKYANRGDLLYLWATNFGPEIWNQEKVIYHYHIWKLKIMNINVSKQYLYTWLITDKERIKQSTNGTTMVHVTKGHIEQREFQIPPNLTEQQKIGTFFKQLDDTIALHQRKLDALKLMKKAFSQQIFPENNRKKPKIRFTSFYEEWEQRKIGEYGYFYYGKSAPKWSVAQDATTPCVRYGELYTKFGPEIDIVHSYTNIDKSNLKFSSGNEVLVPRVGENPLDFANCSWLSISNVAIGEMISVYNTEQYPLFIAYYFRSKMKYEFAKRVEGGNVSNLYYSYLEDILISVPSIEEQKKIAEFLNKIDITINLLQNKLGRIKELKKAYLQNMFI
ncbi:TPA: restriction endonuclease subunit S [Listeria innocua]|uniref:restriction endonuclease subunit S n=1 Tax=Listeria innocua TaxID=1642 RepID=UPI0010B66B0C|nr:restriction endonuclease subunit S [Listeria innocua]EKD7166379.1 restriction endonuclease subunit S [Listeria innocua]EKE5755175.1 restriction endonuclease subunit S [Listeria innocua]MDH4574861.1 restriction endonuclease subunit S [Listeria innocua]HBN5081371.1 restriction endonuclease subunit S [Listeria innocua]HDM8993476.1 restriction endonuclease subunit S [Listeria innocua]